MGGGTWIRISGQFIFGVDPSNDNSTYNTANKTGGEFTHVLTKEEQPLVDGNLQLHGAENGSIFWNSSGCFSGSSVVSGRFTPPNSANTGADSRINVWFSNGGQNRAHNNMPPFRSAHIWYRSA